MSLNLMDGSNNPIPTIPDLDLTDIKDSEDQLSKLLDQHIRNLALNQNFDTTPVEGGYTNETFLPAAVVDQVAEQDRLYLALLNTQYKGCVVTGLEGWDVICKYNTNVHITVWQHTSGEVFVGCRGTSAFARGGYNDLYDDMLTAFGLDTFFRSVFAGHNVYIADQDVIGLTKQIAPEIFNLCNNMSLTRFGRIILSELVNEVSPSRITIGGHSLGGRAAVCLATEFGVKRCVLFNALAPATNPLMQGLGPGKQVHYHIAGDMLSSHSNPLFMDVVRLDRGSFGIPATTTQPPVAMIGGRMKNEYPRISINQSIYFDLVKWHGIENFLNTTGAVKGEIGVDEYDAMWLYNATHFGPEWGADLLKGIATLGLLNLTMYYIAWNTPIPGSRRERWLNKLAYYCSNWSLSTLGDNLNCTGRFMWNGVLTALIGPLLTAFYGTFYVLAFAAVGLVFLGNVPTELSNAFAP